MTNTFNYFSDIFRYYYDPILKICKKFQYSGSGGNQNNFDDLDMCGLKCKRRCLLPRETGLCRANIPRYYYSTDERRCKKFTYGGCKGNGNNFIDENICNDKCGKICSLKPDEGIGKASIKRFYYNPTTKNCTEFTYGGIGGNENNFKYKWICMQTCGSICLLPKKRGRCLASIQNYYYNSKTGKCEKFIYGGCGGNLNNFADIKACEEKCVK